MIPHIKLTDTMRNKYTIDAKKALIAQFKIDPTFMLSESDPAFGGNKSFYFVGQYVDKWIQDRTENWGEVLIKFYQTARGDKRMSIPNLTNVTETGDYVWFTEAVDGYNTTYYNIHIGKELPFDKEQYEQLQERFG